MIRILAATAACLAAAPLFAQGAPTPLSEASLSPMGTLVQNYAGGCWEAPETAEVALRDALDETTIATAGSDDRARSVMILQVNARRAEDGCHGYVKLAISSQLDWQGRGVMPVTLGEVSQVFHGLDNVDGFLDEELAPAVAAMADWLPDD
jgi:hypothetical protein